MKGWTIQDIERYQKRHGVFPGLVDMGNTPKSKHMSQTEREYESLFLTEKNYVYEGFTFKMKNGHSYTPDFILYEEGEIKEAHEVKGSYALGSQRSSKILFDQCVVEFPKVKFVWAKKTKRGWKIKRTYKTGRCLNKLYPHEQNNKT